jgi:hypothetical protein
MLSPCTGIILLVDVGTSARLRVAQFSVNPLFKVESSDKLVKRLKKSIGSKMKNIESSIQEIEEVTGIGYPEYYIEPVLTVAESGDGTGGIGVMFARTIPVEAQGKIRIVVQLTAPLVLYTTKSTLKLVLAHEFLHYLELVKNFSKMDVVSQITSDSLIEELHTDSERAIDPVKVFSSNKRLVRALQKKTHAGLEDEKLNEKCRQKWIEKGLPVVRIPLAENQVRLSAESIVRSSFDPKAVEFVSKI